MCLSSTSYKIMKLTNNRTFKVDRVIRSFCIYGLLKSSFVVVSPFPLFFRRKVNPRHFRKTMSYRNFSFVKVFRAKNLGREIVFSSVRQSRGTFRLCEILGKVSSTRRVPGAYLKQELRFESSSHAFLYRLSNFVGWPSVTYSWKIL